MSPKTKLGFFQLSPFLDDESRALAVRKRDYTMKRLVRTLHISRPADYVMSILGKRYPNNSELFRQSGLPGLYDPMRAGKRMKLATPETWETMVAMKGNKASVWEELLEKKKLPYMATVRNLRNILLAGVNEACVQKVTGYISNEKAVAKSRMFPFQYFTAYDVLTDLENMKMMTETKKKWPKRQHQAADKDKEPWMIKKEQEQKERAKKINSEHLKQVKKALDKAVNIAASKNVPPMKGVCLILCSYGSDMLMPFTAAKGITQKGSSVRDSALLFALMCKKACEKGILVLCSKKYKEVCLQSKDILANVTAVKSDNSSVGGIAAANGQGATEALSKYLKDEVWLDCIVDLHAGTMANHNEMLARYRRDVNPDLVYANININQKPGERLLKEEAGRHPNDLYVSGFSAAVLQMLANFGNGGQIDMVERIDEKYSLVSIPSPLTATKDQKMLQNNTLESITLPKWQKVRVFVSSTFVDMHGERNLLHRYVFPQLKKRARKNFVEVDFVDMRWGITQEQMQSGSQIEHCLEQIQSCDLFLGILGDRYGWVPSEQQKNLDLKKYEMLMQHISNKECSITEIEMQYGALLCREQAKDRAFFYIRDESFSETVPSEWVTQFVTPDKSHQVNLYTLKEMVRRSGLEVYDGYQAQYHGLAGGLPIASGLEAFGNRVLENLWNSIECLYPKQEITNIDELLAEEKSQHSFIQSMANEFVGRKKVMASLLSTVDNNNGKLVNVSGPRGAGATALLANLAQTTKLKVGNSKNKLILPFFFEGSTRPNPDTEFMVKYFFHMINKRLNSAVEIPHDWQSLCVLFRQTLDKFCASGGSVLLVVDRLEDMACNALAKGNIDWLPEEVPESGVIVLSSTAMGQLIPMLKPRKDLTLMRIKCMDMQDRIQLTRSFLAARGKAMEESTFNNQLQGLVTKLGAGSPSYLQLVLTQLCQTGNYERLDEIINEIGSSTELVLQDMLSKAEHQFGKQLVERAACLIYISKFGVTTSQLCSLLSFAEHHSSQLEKIGLNSYQNFCEEMYKDNIKVVSDLEVVGLISYLDEFFKDMKSSSLEGYLLFKQGEFKEVVYNIYLKKTRQSIISGYHKLLASYMYSEYQDSVPGLCPNPIVMQSLPYHLAAAGETKVLQHTICTPQFIQMKCLAGLSQSLYIDFLGNELVLRSAREKFAKDALIAEYKMFVKKYLPVLTKLPFLVEQLILNEPPDSCIRQAFIKTRSKKQESLELLEWINGPANQIHQKQQGYTVREKHKHFVTAMAKSTEMLCLGFNNGAIILSEASTQLELFSLIGHADAITAVNFLTEDKLISASKDGHLSLWDLKNRVRLQSTKAHSKQISCIASQPGGSVLVTIGWDGIIKIWNQQLQNTSVIPHDNGPLNTVVVHPTKQMCIVAGWDSCIRIWDIDSLKQKAVLTGHTSSVQHIRMTKDNRKIVSGSIDGTIMVWDCTIGIPVSSFSIHDSCNILELVDNDHKIMTGGRSGITTIWPVSRGVLFNQIPPNKLTCKIFPHLHHFKDEDVSPENMLEPTSLARSVSSLNIQPGVMMLGFSNGDLQLLNHDERGTFTVVSGWKVSNSAIALIQGKDNYDLVSEHMDWSSMLEEEEEEETSLQSMDWDCDGLFLSDYNFNFSNKDELSGKKTTFWIGFEEKLHGVTVCQNRITCIVKYSTGNSQVKDVTHTAVHNDLIALGCGNGTLAFFDGHPVTKSTGLTIHVSPKLSVHAHHGGVVRVLSTQLYPGFRKKFGINSDNWHFITTGNDNLLRAWRFDDRWDTVTISEAEVTRETLTAPPVGLEMSALRDKFFLFIALNDGTLLKKEILLKDSSEITKDDQSKLSFGPVKKWEGNGLGIVGLQKYPDSDHLLVKHNNGAVSIWSTRGAEVSRYDAPSTSAAFMSSSQKVIGGDNKSNPNKTKLFLCLAREDLKFYSPFEAERLLSRSGHKSFLTSTIGNLPEGTALTAARDGQIMAWPGIDMDQSIDVVGQVNASKVVAIKQVDNYRFLVLEKLGIVRLWAVEDSRAHVQDSCSLNLAEIPITMDLKIVNREHMMVVGTRTTILLYHITPGMYNLDCKLYYAMPFGTSTNYLLGLQAYVETDNTSGEDVMYTLLTVTSNLFHIKMTKVTNGKFSLRTIASYPHVSCTWSGQFDHEFACLPSTLERVELNAQHLEKLLVHGSLWLHPRGLWTFCDGSVVTTCFHEDGKVEFMTAGEDDIKASRTLDLHTGPVTGMCQLTKDRVVTCSEDGTIKLWAGCMAQADISHQMGQFFGLGPPFTAMCALEGRIVAGDAAGNIFCLNVVR